MFWKDAGRWSKAPDPLFFVWLPEGFRMGLTVFRVFGDGMGALDRTGCAVIRPSGLASLPDCFFLDRFAMGNVGGLATNPLPEGHCPSDSLPRFARFEAI